MSNANKVQSVKSIVNNQWKDDKFSLSGLVKYVNSKDGRKNVMREILHVNTKKGNKVQVKVSMLTVKNLLKWMTKGEQTCKVDGKQVKKTRFTMWTVLTVIGRIAKDEMPKAKKAKAKAKAKVETVTGNLPTSELTFAEIRAIAKAKGINSFGMSKLALSEAIA